MGENTLDKPDITLITLELCENCRNSCKMRAPKGATLKCSDYKPKRKTKHQNKKEK